MTKFVVPIRIIFQTSLAGKRCPWVPVFLSNKKLFCLHPNVKCFSHARLYPGREEEGLWILLESLTSLRVNVQLLNALFLWASQKKSVNRTLAKLECGEKLERKQRRWKKSCQAPSFCQEEGFFDNHVTVSRVPVRKLSSKFDVMKSLPEALHWQSIRTKRNSVLARPCKCSLHTSNSSLVRRVYIPYVPQEAKPSKSPEPQPSGGFLGNLWKGWFARDAGKLKLSTSSSSGWKSAFAKWTEACPSTSESTQDRYPQNSRWFTLRLFGIRLLKSTCIKVFKPV